MRALAAALLPGEDWDDTLWCAAAPTRPPFNTSVQIRDPNASSALCLCRPEMCGEYGVDPVSGFDFAAFLAFKADAEHLVAHAEKNEGEPEPEPEAGG